MLVLLLEVSVTLLLVIQRVNAIGYFWNGQSASQSGLYEAELFDVERVEVLRGPQGSLFGAGTTGGVIQMITKRPDGEVGGNIKVDLADYNSSRVSGAINLPLSDTMRTRFAFASLKRDGFVTNSYNDQKLDDRNTLAGRMSFEWDYSDDTTISLIYENTQADDNRLRAARQFCKQDKFYGCSPFENGHGSCLVSWKLRALGAIPSVSKRFFRLHNLQKQSFFRYSFS